MIARIWTGILAAVALLTALAAAGDYLVGMHGVSAYGTALDLGTAVLALVLVFAGLRLMDAALGYDTTERINAMADTPFALYLAGRLLAVALLLGLALS
jgi:uncharacterized protein (UPF0264 family)